MAHPEQMIFLLRVKMKFLPHVEPFNRARVLDCGSLDINGNNRFLFTDCDYTGIDVGEGPNVDYVSLIHEWNPVLDLNMPRGLLYDTIICTEAFEHDPFWRKSMANIIRMLKSGGLFLMTCATGNRPEHGTSTHSPDSSPLTIMRDDFADYYGNLSIKDIGNAVDLDEIFPGWCYEVARENRDLYFWGIKR